MSSSPIADLIAQRLGRRAFLAGAGALAADALVTAIPAGARAPPLGPRALAFAELGPHSGPDQAVAAGYRADVLIRWGDPLLVGAPSFDPANQDPQSQALQFGHNCDHVAFLPLPRGSASSDHGLLCVNHEYVWPNYLMPGYRPGAATPEALARFARIGMNSVGCSVVEVRRQAGRWRLVERSRFSRRLMASGPEMDLVGPARGHARMRTAADPHGVRARGTYANCAGGKTPWGTALSCEEGFFLMFSGQAPEGHAEAQALAAYRIGTGDAPPWWALADPRFDAGSEPNEANRFGWVVEYDPYDPDSTARKLTALGRFQHEAANPVVSHDGRVVIYLGDDGHQQHLYRFVSEGRVSGDRARDARLLETGELSVACFDADGGLRWKPMRHGEGPLDAANGFHGQADVLIDARRAARLLGATPMDRPEDVEPHPSGSKIYVVMTGSGAEEAPNAANPRRPNPYGHVIELRPPALGGGAFDHAAERFGWDLFLLAGDPGDPAHGALYGGEVSDAGWLVAPDNIAFDPAGRLWLATDKGRLLESRNDGLWACQTQGPAAGVTRHFYGAPSDAEVCGPEFTPDGSTLFLAIQHPGIDGFRNGFESASTRWPDFDPAMPPRPSLVAITRTDGGTIGG